MRTRCKIQIHYCTRSYKLHFHAINLSCLIYFKYAVRCPVTIYIRIECKLRLLTRSTINITMLVLWRSMHEVWPLCRVRAYITGLFCKLTFQRRDRRAHCAHPIRFAQCLFYVELASFVVVTAAFQLNESLDCALSDGLVEASVV